MQRIDEKIHIALKRSAERCGSILALSRLLNVSHSTVLFWLSGKIRHISTDLWQQNVFPVLEEDLYLLSGEKTPCEVRNFYLGSKTGNRRVISVPVPLMKEDGLLRYRPVLENITSFVNRTREKRVLREKDFNPEKEYFAVQLCHLKKEYALPWEVLAFFTENTCLTDNELVLLRMQKEAFIRICRFRTAGQKSFFEDFITAEPVAGSPSDATEPYPLEWVFPIATIHFFRSKQEIFNIP
jgi:hypothetical protein